MADWNQGTGGITLTNAHDVEVERGDGQLQLAIALTKADTESAVAAAVARWGAAASEADFANMALLDRRSSVVRVVHAASLNADIAARWTEFSLDTPTPLSDAIRTGEPVLLGSLDEYVGRYDQLIPDTRAAGLQATASIPLQASSGEGIGALGFAWPERQEFPPALLARLALISRLTAQALERVEAQGRVSPGSDIGTVNATVPTSAAEESYEGAAEIIAGWFIDFLEHEMPGGSTLSLSVLFDRLDRAGWAVVRRSSI